MSSRTETADAERVATEVLTTDDLVDVFGPELDDIASALVVQYNSDGDALVLAGDVHQLTALGLRISAAIAKFATEHTDEEDGDDEDEG